jgi:hypothetical protein
MSEDMQIAVRVPVTAKDFTGPWAKMLLALGVLARHFLIAAVFLLGVRLLGLWMHTLWGKTDPSAYDILPWRYVFDTMDLAVVVVFGAYALWEAIRVVRE